ncbi:MAG: nicotinate phosphoribosyltransferase, partial [Rhodothermales bacterium]
IEAHDVEEEAFEAFSELFPETILLVDTYDTLEGVRKVIDLARRKGDAFDVRGIRLDSGDLAQLAIDSRSLLDEAGLENVKIFASSSLDEHKITELIDAGAPIDGFGVGTRMGTIADQPYLDSAYKLSGYADKPRMKLSSEKSNLPGQKQVFRTFQDGVASGDVIAAAEETCDGEPLLHQFMRNGQRMPIADVTLDEIRAHAAEELERLPERLRGVPKQEPGYDVRLSERLEARLRETRERLEREQA